MSLYNFKIGAKLGIAFFIGILLTVILGVFSIFQLSRMNGNTTEITTNWMPSLKAVNGIRITVNQFRLAEADHVMSTDDKDKSVIEARLAELKKKLSDQQTKYEALISSDEERKLYAQFKDDKEKFFGVHDKLIALSRGGEKTLQETKTYYRSESGVAFNGVLEELIKIDELNEGGASYASRMAQETYGQSRAWVTGLVGLNLVLAILLAVWITRLITLPMARAVKAAELIAGGDLTADLHAQGQDETAQLLNALSHMQANLAKIVGSVREGSESVSTASAEIASGNHDLSARTEQQASSLEETAASMEELNSTVKQNADSARQANQLATSASTVAIQGGEVVAEVVDTMKGINESSRKISDIISVIDGIAFQTNILALNAAVEAARAGEQGRGFAVVASEVRSLAGRSAEAAKEIKSLINASVERVEQGTALVDKAGATMTEVVSSIRRVTDIMGEISAASAEQSAGVAQVGQAVTQMDQATQQNAALVEEMAAAASSLKSQAQELVQTVAVFKLSGNLQQKATAPAAAVRSNKPKLTPHKGPERREGGIPKGAAARSHAPAPKLVAPPPAAKTPAGGDDDWTTF